MKKLYILLFLIFILAGCDSPVGNSDIIEPIDELNMVEKTIIMKYSDDNTGEDYIIKSDKKDYNDGLAGSDVYFSITSQSNDDVAISFENVEVLWIKKYSKTEKEKEVIEYEKYECEEQLIASSGEPILPKKLCDKVKETKKEKYYVDEWEDVGEVFELSKGTTFFKAHIKYSTGDKGEFDIVVNEFMGGLLGGEAKYGRLDPWYNSSWDYRIKITIQNGQVGENETDFPIFVNLNNLKDDFWDNVKEGGGDIRVTNSTGNGELAREVVMCETATERGELWFLADSISSTTDTDFYIYYGNAGASDYGTTTTYGRNNVWGDYVAVYHLGEQAGSAIDSSGNSNDGSFVGDLPTQQPGKTGICQEFDGGGDYITIANSAELIFGTNPFVLQNWFKTGTDAEQRMVSKGQYDTGSEAGYYVKMQVTTNNIQGIATDGDNVNVKSSNGLDNNAWHKLTCVFSGGNLGSMYIDGAADGTDSGAYDIDSTNPVNISGYNQGTAENFTGLIDEVRLSQQELDADWIATEYVNQNTPSTFYATSSEESAPVSEAIFIPKAGGRVIE